jgi:hypothetical protein
VHWAPGIPCALCFPGPLFSWANGSCTTRALRVAGRRCASAIGTSDFPWLFEMLGAKRPSDPDFVISGWSKDQTSDANCASGNPGISGFDASHPPGMTDALRLYPDGKTLWVRSEAIGRPCAIRPLEQISRQSVIGNAPTQVTDDGPDERAACSARLENAYAIAADDAKRRQEAEYDRPEKTADADRSAPRRKSWNFAAQFAAQAATGAEGLSPPSIAGATGHHFRKKRKRL